MGQRVLLPLLIAAASVLFAIGAAIEPSNHHDEGVSAESAEHVEGESAEAHAQEAGGESGEAGDENEDLFGVDVESTPLVVLAVVGSLALALAAYVRPGWRPLLLVIAIAMLAFAALDVRELVHQLDESNGGVAVIAAVVAALHLAASGVAWRQAPPAAVRTR
jgi:hypothetical protein